LEVFDDVPNIHDSLQETLWVSSFNNIQTHTGVSARLLGLLNIETSGIFIEAAKRAARYPETLRDTAAVEVVGNGPGTTEKEPWQMKHSWEAPMFYSCFSSGNTVSGG